ncbi:MAG: copper homeostasis protein CutC, partial [Erysipelotrichaceae bacterium]|nr:copper homeostasis protein CutC [Erysipelotrichaceae bacterium]
MINNITIEICIGNIDDAIVAAKYPIDRIELNSALELGGLTPSLETLRFLKTKIDTRICCMVRPRGGDFCYTENEFQTMLKDAGNLLDNGADGIVFGFLHEDQTIDHQRSKAMVDLIHSYGKEAIFHKAFDDCPDLDAAAKDLVSL